MLVFAPVRKHKVPPLRFASVGMTELLREGVAQAELPTSRAQNAREMGHPAQADREEFSGREEKDAGIGCLGPDCASGQGLHSSRKERDKGGPPERLVMTIKLSQRPRASGA